MDKQFFGIAADEVAKGRLDSDLYVKALALSDGQETRAKSTYIQLRAEELARAQQDAIDQVAQADRDRGSRALKQVLGGFVGLLILLGLAIAYFDR